MRNLLTSTVIATVAVLAPLRQSPETISKAIHGQHEMSNWASKMTNSEIKSIVTCKELSFGTRSSALYEASKRTIYTKSELIAMFAQEDDSAFTVSILNYLDKKHWGDKSTIAEIHKTLTKKVDAMADVPFQLWCHYLKASGMKIDDLIKKRIAFHLDHISHLKKM